MNHTLALTELLGAPVIDSGGAVCGRVREVALAPQEDRAKVAMLVVKTKAGNRNLPFAAVVAIHGGVRTDTSCGEWADSDGSEGLLLLERDLLDQQVIDVDGRKVVRVQGEGASQPHGRLVQKFGFEEEPSDVITRPRVARV